MERLTGLGRALSGFLLIMFAATIWCAGAYRAIGHIQRPLAFTNASCQDNSVTTFWDYVYSSMMDISPFGYGKIHPQSPFTQALALLEWALGLFLLLVVATVLVGAYHDMAADRDAAHRGGASPVT